ncbi:MAG: GNAT family N-acetyltransferase, partial [Nitrososphaerales archaeon]
IERLSGERFREVGLEIVAEDEPASLETLANYASARSWVATDEDFDQLGYALVDLVDGCAHVEQISVLPDYQGQGIGRALLDQVAGWAQQTRLQVVTLTTFAEVSWNRPLYEHLGFDVLPETEIGPELMAVRSREAAHGLDPAIRVCMRLDLSRRGSTRHEKP